MAAFICGLFGLPAPALACPNDEFRRGPSADLPDCRAYELVTPRDTNGASPLAANSPLVGGLLLPPPLFASAPAAASGDAFVFGIIGTTLPGTDGGGFSNAYRAERGAGGWTTALFGPDSQQAAAARIGGFSADQSLQSFRIARFEGRFSGSLALGLRNTVYLRAADGSFRLPGEGTLAADPDNDGNPNGRWDELDPRIDWISSAGDHVVFSQGEEFQGGGPVRLLAASPPPGTGAIYDRTPDALRIVSVLPDGEVPSDTSSFEGASADGSTVLFRTGEALFARVDNSVTREIGSGELLAAGLSDDGTFAFYAEGATGVGNLFRYDTRSGASAPISTSGDSQFVNVSPDGSHVYFESPSLLDGQHGVGGAPNLYVWDGATTRFIATVTDADLARREEPSQAVVGLTRWASPTPRSPASNGDVVLATSRVTPDGEVFAFESEAALTGFDNDGQVEIYRYDDRIRTLTCVSCGRILQAPTSGAHFADYEFRAVGRNTVVGNLSADGQTVFFQTGESLLGEDVDRSTDVYEWHEGNLALISAGGSSQPSLLMGATPDGGNVFIRTAAQLVPAAQQVGALAIYDARVGGGFPAEAGPDPDPCTSGACQRGSAAEAAEPIPASAQLLGPRHRRKPCGRRHSGSGRRHPRCVKRHHHHGRHVRHSRGS
jgi:hypothetical protein